MADWKKIFDDAVGQIEEAAQVAGEGLQRAAGEAGKIVGIGVGTIDLRLEGGAQFGFSDWITGAVVLSPTEPIQARSLSVTLRATQRQRVRVQSRGRSSRGTTMQDEVIYEFVQELAGEQDYVGGEFPFELQTPSELDERVDVGGLLGDALRAARAVKSMTERPLRWRLIATLEIPWKRNLSKSIDVSIREDVAPRPRPTRTSSSGSAGPTGPTRPTDPKTAEPEPPKSEAEPASAPEPEPAAPEPAAPEPAPPPKRDVKPFVVPPPISIPGGWGQALAGLMGRVLSQGWELLHQWSAPPVDPAVVQQVLARHPDLDPEILMFYSLMDGLELILGKPTVHRTQYDSALRIREAAARDGGVLGCIDELWSTTAIGDALEAEFSEERGGELRMLEIPRLARLFDDSEDFCFHGDRQVIYGRIVLGYGDYLGLVHADEIQRWRSSGDGQYDHYADTYQACLRTRVPQRPGSWWAVWGDDHGAALHEPPRLMGWSEMLAACLRHLENGER